MVEYIACPAITKLEIGDIVRNRGSAHAYVVVQHHGSHVTAVRAIDVSNPPEWELLRRTEPERHRVRELGGRK